MLDLQRQHVQLEPFLFIPIHRITNSLRSHSITLLFLFTFIYLNTHLRARDTRTIAQIRKMYFINLRDVNFVD